jgi:hypothetical protein
MRDRVLVRLCRAQNGPKHGVKKSSVSDDVLEHRVVVNPQALQAAVETRGWQHRMSSGGRKADKTRGWP